MQFTIKINVTAGKAEMLQMPELAEGSAGIVSLAVSFDQSWDVFPKRTAIFRREGEASRCFSLDTECEIPVPPVFTLSDEPFLIRVTGENAEQCIQTNEICARFGKLDSLNAPETQFSVYGGTYTLTENKTYPVQNCLMADNLTVAVPTRAIGFVNLVMSSAAIDGGTIMKEA